MSQDPVLQARSHVLNGISAELARAVKYVDFRVTGRRQEGPFWLLSVEVPATARMGLDESLEGASAWWKGPPKGAADVLSVLPEAQQINLRYATGTPPGTGDDIRLYPPQFLEALERLWQDPTWSQRCLEWRDHLDQANDHRPTACPGDGHFPWLRAAQRSSFALPGWQAGFLWGPPGTGKTRTLGAMLASYLVKFPQARVLLLSTTNTAVDLALVSVDRALEELEPRMPAAREARRRCFRLGNHFVARHYVGREHLIPVKDEELVRALVALEAKRPDPSEVQAYGQWKAAVEALRERMRQHAREILERSRLGALTTALATFWFTELAQFAPFDLVVFDEASQVGQAYALALTPLGRHAVFAGDPEQLAPIVQSGHDDAVEWLGTSMFQYMDDEHDSTCFLDEQSRMAADICKVVSNVFYRGRLRVACDCEKDPDWVHERRLAPVADLSDRCFTVLPVDASSTWSRNYNGPIRYGTAELIRELVERLARHVDQDDILVLTPFRAQRVLIRQFLTNAGLKRINVSTVHRAQGGERHTVIFDPVDGGSDFLKTSDARRLINVALSRAKARLVVLLSPHDRGNSLLDRIANVMVHVPAGVPSISGFVGLPSFPECLLGTVVQIGTSAVGEVTQVLDGGAKFELRDFRTGELRVFVTDFVRRKFGGGSAR